MRFSMSFLGLGGVGMLALTLTMPLTACSSDSNGGGGAGGTASTSTTSTGGNTGSTGYPCSLKATCKALIQECIGLADNKGQAKPGLRMAELDIAQPAKLSSGFVAQLIASDVMLSDKTCNLSGNGTFSWLIQFDTTAGTLTTGGAKFGTGPDTGYEFVNETIAGIPVAPVSFNVVPDASGKWTLTEGKDLAVPVYLSPTDPTSVVVLPFKQARFSTGTLSNDGNCIGYYNAEGLDPANACLADDQNHTFVSGGTLDAVITLEDADKVIVSQITSSLCYFLMGGSGKTKDAKGNLLCDRDSNNMITAAGDACSMAGGSCTDALTLKATFAASSVKINN